MRETLKFWIFFVLIISAFAVSASEMPVMEDTIALNDRFNFRQSVQFDNDGHIHMTYTGQYDTDGTTREIFYATNQSGQFEVLQLTSNGVDNNFASFAFDKNGNIHIIYLEHETVSNTFQIAYRNSMQGAFSEPIWLTSGFNKASPHIAIGSNNIIHLAYNSYHFTDPNLDDHVYYKTYNFVTGNMGAEVQLGLSNPSSEKETRIAVDSNNHAHIIYRSESSWSGPLKYYNNTGGAMTEYATPVEGNITGPAIAMDNSDNLHIIYRQGNAIHYTLRDAEGDFSPPVLVTPENVGIPTFYRSVDVDEQGRFYFMYQNSVATAPKGFFLVHGLDGQFEEPVLVSAKTDNGYLTLNNTAVAARGDGEVAVTYAASTVRNDDIVCDIFLKHGNIFDPPVSYISVSPRVLDFGENPVGTENTLYVTIENKGFADLTISGAQFSDDNFFTSQELPFVAEPGASFEMPVIFNPFNAGSFESYFTLMSDAANQPALQVQLLASAILVYYNLSFEVLDAAQNPIDDAVITLNNTAYPEGHYLFENTLPGTHHYKVSKSGFLTVEGEAVITTQDKHIAVTLEEGTFINDLTQSAYVRISPNPADSYVSIDSDYVMDLLRIIDFNGSLLSEIKVNGYAATLNVSDWAAGVYVVQIISAHTSSSARLIVR